MPYNNEYNEKLARSVEALNKQYILNENETLDPKTLSQFYGSGKGKLEGGFLGMLASAVLPMLINKIAGGKKADEESDKESEYESESESDEESEKKEGGAMYNKMRDSLEGSAKVYKDYKHQSEDKYACGMGKSGGSSFGVGQGSIRDTGEGVTDGKNLGMGKKRGRKSKMGSGLAGAGVTGGKKRGRKSKKMEGAGVISDLGIPVISNIAGLFGLGHSGGARSDPLRPEKFYPKVLAQTAPNADKAVPPAGIVDTAQNIGSNMSGFGKRGRKKASPKEGGKSMLAKTKEVKAGGKKPNPWMELMAKVRKEHPELKGVKAVADYIKKNNLYKK